MPVPPLLAAAAPAVIQGLGGLAARLIGGRKERVPDLVAPAVNTAQQQLADLEDAQIRNLALLEDRSARTGSTGTAAREDLLNANARGDASIRASILDTVANARQQQELLQADADNRRRQGVIQGITSGVGTLAEGIGGLLNPVDVNAGNAPQAVLDVGIAPASPTVNFNAGFNNAPDLQTQIDRTLNPSNQLVELDFRPGQSLTNFSTARAPLASTLNTFSNGFFRSNQ